MRMNKNTRKIVCLLLCLCCALSVLSAAAPHMVRAEEAQENESRRVVSITTAKEFLELAENCRLDSFSQGLTVVLEKDIDLSGVNFSGIPTFSGIFEGSGKSITGLSVQTEGSVQGLFRYLTQTAVVRNLMVSGEVAPAGSRSTVGAIAGINKGSIINCVFSGRVSGADSIGGLAGFNDVTGIIDSCSVYGSVHGSHFVGGAAGKNNGVIRGCRNYSQVNTTVEQNSIYIGDITLESLMGSETVMTTTDIGGIAGTNAGVVRECINSADVGYPHIGYNIGGIAGSHSGYMTGCENSGRVSGRKEIGGIVGQMEPSVELAYENDTMQILEGQLGQMSAMIDSTAASVQSGAGEMQGQMGVLQGQIKDAQNAMDQLIPDPSNPELPDDDTTLAALNSLSSALSAMSGTLSGMYQTGQDTMDAITGDMEGITEQMNAIGSTISNASSGLGGNMHDVSDEDTDEDLTGKVENCLNTAAVKADLNAGGIVGAMAFESDLDPENDIYISGSSSMNYECNVRSVVLRCRNSGTVTVHKQNAGGIAGWMSLGLVRECMNSGMIDSANADYVGGIAGQSQGFIRFCGAKCQMKGQIYVGGIAGTGSVVTDCRSMIIIASGSEKLGAVVGYAGENISPEGEELPMRGNYYLPVESDHGAIDGISYNGIAQALDSGEFFALEALPEIFREITVRFVYEDGSEKTVVLAPGSALTISDIPAVPVRSGYIGFWEGLESVDLSDITFDTVFQLVYTAKSPAVQSGQTGRNGLPLVIAQGDFTGERGMKLTHGGIEPELKKGEQIAGMWKFILPESDSPVQLRYLLEEPAEADELRLMIYSDASGSWRNSAFYADGSYLVFSVDSSDSIFCVVREKDSILPEILIAAAGVVTASGIAAAVIKSKKKRAKNEAAEVTADDDNA